MTYATTNKVSEVIEALKVALALLAPTLCASVLFVRYTDTDCKLENVTDPARFRLFEIRRESPTYGSVDWSSTVASLECVLRIRVGYPAADYYPEDPDELTSENERYLTEDLKAEDFKQLVLLLEGSGTVLGTISGVQLVALRGEQDEAGGKVRSVLYGLQYTESFA